MRFMSWTTLALLAVSVVGCSTNPREPVAAANNTGVAEHSVAKDSETPATAVTVAIKSWAEIQTWVASQRGKVVVLDVWSNS